MKDCPSCAGAGRIRKPLERSWWKVLFRYPATTDDLCLVCFGAGVVPSSAEEKERLRKKQRAGHENWKATFAAPSVAKPQSRVRVIGETAKGKEYYINCACGQSGFRSFDPNDVCDGCKFRAEKAKYAPAVRETEMSGHRGPWCRYCGARYIALEHLPTRTDSHGEGTHYCTKCGSDRVY